MGLDPLLEDYRYEIKENTGRRGLALFVDELVLTLPMLFFVGIFSLVIYQTNPLSPFLGILSPLIYHYEVYGVESTPVLVAMIPSIFVSLAITIFYFTFFGSNGRRTLGKKSLHLETLRRDGMFPTAKQAFMRDIVKIAAGAVGYYLLGLFGWGLFMGMACLLDLKLYPGRKRDVRQRLSEAMVGTMVYLENDEVPMGEISFPGGKIRETKEKKKGLKGRIESLSRKRSRGVSKRMELPEEGRPLLAPDVEIERKEGALLSQEGVGKEKTEVEEGQEPGKVSFFKKLFGWMSKGSKGEKGKDVEIEQVPGPNDIIQEKEPIPLPPRKEIARDEIILQFMFDFDIDEARANGLYDMGYRTKAELKDAIPQDLMMIKGINPTIAKRIISRANE